MVRATPIIRSAMTRICPVCPELPYREKVYRQMNKSGRIVEIRQEMTSRFLIFRLRSPTRENLSRGRKLLFSGGIRTPFLTDVKYGNLLSSIQDFSVLCTF